MQVWHRRHLAECSAVPWKNGGGTTRELWIDPPGSRLSEGFHARISVAEVGSSGPFSLFPGMDRSLLLLEGRDLEVDFGAHGIQHLKAPLQPIAFPGEWPAAAELRSGPCRDFNVMTARTHCSHQLQVLRPGDVCPACDRLALFAVGGSVRLGDSFELASEELLVIQNDGSLEVLGHSQAAVIAIRFSS